MGFCIICNTEGEFAVVSIQQALHLHKFVAQCQNLLVCNLTLFHRGSELQPNIKQISAGDAVTHAVQENELYDIRVVGS